MDSPSSQAAPSLRPPTPASGAKTRVSPAPLGISQADARLASVSKAKPLDCYHPDFPLNRDDCTGQWRKVINKRRVNFGSIRQDPTGERAWQWYKKEKPFWESGINPRELAQSVNDPEASRVQAADISTRWLKHRFTLITHEDKEKRIDKRTYDTSAYAQRRYLEILDEIADRNADPLTWKPNIWARVRALLGQKPNGEPVSPATKDQRVFDVRKSYEWAAANGLIPKLPDWAGEFDNVKQATKEEYRYDYQQENGERFFDLNEARMLLECIWMSAERAGLNSNNASGFRGVSERPDGRFEAYIVRRVRDAQGNRKRTKFHLGVFATAKQAAEAYRKEADQIGSKWQQTLIVGAQLFRACSYLAANTGAYSKDIASLRLQDLQLENRYLERKRSKTSVLWQAALWRETVHAIREYLKVRPQAARPEFEELVFLTSNGLPVNLDTEKYDEDGNYSHTNRKDNLKARMRRLLIDLGIKAKGVNFGAWRHTFRSLASSALRLRRKEDLYKFDAINRTMAHQIPGSADRYVHLSYDQLKPVTRMVRKQLWPERVAEERERARQKREEKRRLEAARQAPSGPDLRLVS